MFTSSVKSPAPKATRLTRVPPARIASIWLRPRAVSMIGLKLGEEPVGRRKPGSAFDLRQNDAVEPRADDRRQVAVTELGVDRIHADIQQRSPRARQRRDHRVALFSAVATASSRSRITA